MKKPFNLRQTRLLRSLLIALLFSSNIAANTALAEVLISALTSSDEIYLQHQWQRIDELSRSKLGWSLQKLPEHDVQLLQRLLDEGHVKRDDVLTSQAMGVVIGELYCLQRDSHWVIYEDELGRSRAVQLGQSKEVVFPITMISRRWQVGNAVDVNSLYQTGLALLLKSPQPSKMPF